MPDGIAKSVRRLPSMYNLCALDNGLLSESVKLILHHADRLEICTSCKDLQFSKYSSSNPVMLLPTVNFFNEARSSTKHCLATARPRYKVSMGFSWNGLWLNPLYSSVSVPPSSNVRFFNAVHPLKAHIPIVDTPEGIVTDAIFSHP